ncbi:DNA topoisomerase (ATP-hydrolyzing) subunit A [Merdimmobilis hominis]|uniref:DNA gyrase subunit A n=2 Tax=Oscillospiraceae TaxID=216572 RepID=A0A6N2QZS5_9FIRM|nr:DNA topoisomerase (ATP-hydrolyzing) subunit A [uncultured Merdimmobilis sp.]PWL56554.1 MAG: topoisomerase IV [Oscillospiraceae bacterium]PWL62159.1 MAG: topoisomerase IV [Oscillospiraceae bacterium]
MPPRKKKERASAPAKMGPDVYIENSGVVMDQAIVDTLEKNYMPYAMSVIVSRAIPEIDGFKPSHRKILYTMYTMGLLNGNRTKSANIVGQTMKLNPHGDAAIYETMVRLSRGYEALLYPFVDSKGNFGKAYSRDMAYAAPRYTEAKLEPICSELFGDIAKDTVDFVPNYDNTMMEPTLLPVSFPTILTNSNVGIAVGMASSICPFNLAEVCETTIALMKNPAHDVATTLQAPDFPGGGFILYDPEEMRRIYETGRGGVKVRARYSYDKAENCIEITQIPPTTTVEAIMDKIVELVKSGRVREISDLRDETDINGLKLTIDLKRGVDPDKLMARLYKTTPLEDAFGCNFNVLIGGMPKVLGVAPLLLEWIAFREECVKRRIFFDLTKKKEKLHLLKGLARILLDIDKAVKIVRETEEESEVVPNLMIGFGIDEIQAEYVAEIRLRHLNREYILKRTQETEQLESDIAQMEDILKSPKKIQGIMEKELREVAKKFSQPRRSMLIFKSEVSEEGGEEEIPDYPVRLFLSKEGYFKKITPQSLRMSGEQKLKEGDAILEELEATNNTHLLVFTNQCQVYKCRASDFDDGKASQLGDYLPAKLGMDEGESVVYLAATADYQGAMVFVFQNGKVAKVEMSAYETKTRRKKLISAYCDKFPLCQALYLQEDRELMLTSSGGRVLLVHTAALESKSTKNTQGIQVMQLKKNAVVDSAKVFCEGMLSNPHRFRPKSLPSQGQFPRGEEEGEQLTLS